MTPLMKYLKGLDNPEKALLRLAEISSIFGVSQDEVYQSIQDVMDMWYWYQYEQQIIESQA